jgi:hypothetical protein
MGPGPSEVRGFQGLLPIFLGNSTAVSWQLVPVIGGRAQASAEEFVLKTGGCEDVGNLSGWRE